MNTDKIKDQALTLEQLEGVAGGRLLNDTEVLDMENCYLKFNSYISREAADGSDIEAYMNLQDQYAQYMKKQRVNSKQYLFSDFLRDKGFGFWID